MAQSSLPYDITSSTSIFEYSKGLLGKTLRDFVWEGYKPKKGKGSFGQGLKGDYLMKQLIHLYATYDLHNHLRILLLCTIRNYTNQLNHRINFSPNHKSTNGLNGGFLLDSVYTHAHCLGRSSRLQASVPS